MIAGMRTLIAAFVVATIVAALVTPLVRLLALHLGAVSVPGGRHHHGRKIPRLGGIGIFVAILAPIAALLATESSVAALLRHDWQRGSAMLAGGVAMCALGALDDTRRIRALIKLYVQIGVAVLAWTGGFRILAIEVPFVGVLSMGIFALPVTVAWIVGITNAINLIDGLDGLAAGVVFFAALTNLVVGYVSGVTFTTLIMACTLGSVLGFLFYNFNPARIFMGDSGSYLLGFILATSSLVGTSQKASTAVSILVPILALGVPILDTLSAMVRRYLARRSLFSADRSHIHHRLLDMGLTHRRAVLILYGASCAFAIAAIGLSLGRNWAIGTILLTMSVAVTGLIRFVAQFGSTFGDKRQKARLRSKHAELFRRLLPDYLPRFSRMGSEGELWELVREIGERAQLSRVEVLDSPHNHEGAVVRSIVTQPTENPFSPDLVQARYPLGEEAFASASVRFAWNGEYGEVSAQEEVLLQLLVDACARQLSRLCSPLAAAVPEQIVLVSAQVADEAPR